MGLISRVSSRTYRSRTSDYSNTSSKMAYLGIDMSTQQCKVLAMSDDGKIVATAAVNYEKELNAHLDASKKQVTQKAQTWKQALVKCFRKLQQQNFDFSKVIGISGCGQQHGSVYFSSENFDPNLETLCFDGDSPIWMDSSTSDECDFLEEKFGKNKLKEVTGSYAFTRFTASQILKRRRESFPGGADTIKKICLVSSFIPSLLTGKFCPIDTSDGSGMNLLDLEEKSWHPELANLAKIPQPEKFFSGPPANPNKILGNVSQFWTDNFGLTDKCQVVAFTGDNPSALIGVGASEVNNCVVSLGTSDTIFINLPFLPKDSKEAHIFCSPLGKNDEYMALCCYRNGSLTREQVLKNFGLELTAENWDRVSQILQNPKQEWLDQHLFTVNFNLKEITPNLGPNFVKRFENFEAVETSSSFEEEIFALITGQILAKKAHIKRFLGLEHLSKLIVTGGASNNSGMLQLLSNIFQAEVYRLTDSSEAAAFGGCIKAKFALSGDLVKPEATLAAAPDESLKTYYEGFVEKYLELEEKNFQ